MRAGVSGHRNYLCHSTDRNQQSPTIGAVVNGASFAKGGIVPGEIATIFGSNLTSSTGINITSFPLPTTSLMSR